ncbi:MAG: HIT domain-containing protein [Planctomycetota bacterium]|nr:HIT domain-containing protein [Planctomycetota bacterium]
MAMERLWAPWRMAYIARDGKKDEGECFFCRAWRETGQEKKHLLLARSGGGLVMLNRYPYTSAHLLIAPASHLGAFEDIGPEEGGRLWSLTAFAKKALSRALAPHGFNIGINQGRPAGAGVLDHLHIHLVPRWEGDVNFMPVLADARVISQALEETWEKLAPHFRDPPPA